ncbi:uncharacterized protein TNCV_4776281 [Trichonephila clavipes]|nr:uncharacterized protein TNCV_4776281 [Trichonephila clavipes]
MKKSRDVKRMEHISLRFEQKSLYCYAVGSLVVRASDSRPECLGSMPDATKYPSNAHSEKVLWAESRVQGIGEYFPSIQFHGKIVEVEIGGFAIYRPFEEFLRAKSYCHLYGAQGLGQRQAYF